MGPVSLSSGACVWVGLCQGSICGSMSWGGGGVLSRGSLSGVSLSWGVCVWGSMSLWGLLSRGSPSLGVFQGDLCWEGLCPGGSLSRGLCSGESVSGEICLGVSVQRGSVLVGSLSGVSVLRSLPGGLCPGGSVSRGGCLFRRGSPSGEGPCLG